MSAFILCAGYSTTTPLYSEIVVKEREYLQMMRFSGMRNITYFLGMLLADYIIFLIPTTMFCLFCGLGGLDPYSNSILDFVTNMLASGFPIIIVSYLISNFFDKADYASRWNIII